jgi:hypothetical protein
MDKCLLQESSSRVRVALFCIITWGLCSSVLSLNQSGDLSYLKASKTVGGFITAWDKTSRSYVVCSSSNIKKDDLHIYHSRYNNATTITTTSTSTSTTTTTTTTTNNNNNNNNNKRDSQDSYTYQDVLLLVQTNSLHEWSEYQMEFYQC